MQKGKRQRGARSKTGKIQGSEEKSWAGLVNTWSTNEQRKKKATGGTYSIIQETPFEKKADGVDATNGNNRRSKGRKSRRSSGAVIRRNEELIWGIAGGNGKEIKAC